MDDTMTAQPATLKALTSSSLDPNLVILGLEQTEQLKYLHRIGSRHGFNITSRWASTSASLLKTITSPSAGSPHATLANLRFIAVKIITSANCYYAIDEILPGSQTQALTSLKQYNKFNQTFADVFPSKLDDSTGLPSTPGHHLTTIENLGDGTAFIFSYVILKRISGKSKLSGNHYPVQFFNTVFIPNDLSRIEYRIDRKLGRRLCNKASTELRNEFLGILAEQRIILQLNTVNFFKAITNAYDDSSYGRVVQVDFIDKTGDEDASLKCRTNPKYDARNRAVVNTSQGNTKTISQLEVFGVAVRFDYHTNQELHHNEIGFETNRVDWVNRQFCEMFYFEQSSDNAVHYGVINDILKRAK